MTNITFRSDVDVSLVQWMGGDEIVCQAARVSTKGAAAPGTKESAGLINYLVNNRHSSPLEHSVFTFFVSIPIFVSRELVRHRIASFNETSGRYMELAPVFYVPARERNLTQIGKTGDYTFQPGTDEQYELVTSRIESIADCAWEDYQAQLAAGVAKEVARMVLPVNIYTSLYVTINARSLMNLLSLRTQNEGATIRSTPQHEIQLMADPMEAIFAEKMPITHAAWHAAGRGSP